MSDESPLQRIVSRGIETIGAGAGAFFGVGVDPAAAAVAAMAGTAVGAMGSELASRLLSPRQEIRVGAVFFYAGAAIKAKEIQGESIRTDGFFDGDRSHGHEFAEGVMLVAMETFEERKIPYLGNLLANVSFATAIDPATANFALRVAEELSWLECCLLGMLDRPDDYPMPDEPQRTFSDWKAHTVKDQLSRMADYGGFRLLTYRQYKSGKTGLMMHDLNLSGLRSTNNGRLITGLMELDKIPSSELRPVYELLLSGELQSDDTNGDGNLDEKSAAEGSLSQQAP